MNKQITLKGDKNELKAKTKTIQCSLGCNRNQTAPHEYTFNIFIKYDNTCFSLHVIRTICLKRTIKHNNRSWIQMPMGIKGLKPMPLPGYRENKKRGGCSRGMLYSKQKLQRRLQVNEQVAHRTERYDHLPCLKLLK